MSAYSLKWTFAFFIGDKPNIRKMRIAYSRAFKSHTWTFPDFCVFPTALKRENWIDLHLLDDVRVTYLQVSDKQFELMRTSWHKRSVNNENS